MSSWWPGCLEKEGEVFTDGGRVEEGEEGLGGETETARQGSEKAVSKFMILWKKLRGPTAEALGSCGRKGCAQNREIKAGILIQMCSGRVHEWRPGSERRGQGTPLVVTAC